MASSNFGGASGLRKSVRPQDLKLPKGRIGSFNRQARDLNTKKLEKKVAHLTTKWQGSDRASGADRAKLLGYRRALTQRILSRPQGSKDKPFGAMNRQERRKALKSKLGDKFSTYYFQKSKGKFSPPNNRLK